MSINEKPTISLDDDPFGAVLNCAVRYALGRQNYMPGVVIEFITPLLPYLNNRTLRCFDQDLSDARWYGDPQIDEPRWIKFLNDVRNERISRGKTPYVSHREF